MPHSLTSALAACEQACSQESSDSAYDALLWAVGNNHAGTYNASALLLAPLTSNVRPVMPHLSPSPQLVEQRIRNRIIEWLEMMVTYQTDPPPWDLNEALNQWEDWNSSPAVIESYPQPVFTSEEAACLVSVGNAWSSYCDATPKTISREIEAMSKPEWANLVGSASRALAVLKRRGKLPEDSEFHRVNPQA